VSTQQLFYENVTPVSPQRHGNLSVQSGAYFEFARKVNSVPLMALEIPAAAREYSIVFAPAGDSVMPVVVLGVEGHDNLYVSGDGGWDGTYVPAFVRRFPFVFSRSDDESTFTLCVDESWTGCNEDGQGERLFNDDGERTQYLQNVLNFLEEYQAQFQRTQAFCNRLRELDLLEEMKAEFALAGGEQRTLTGFQAINRDRLKALPPETLGELTRSDELELIYIHLQSMNNFTAMLNKVREAHDPSPETKAESEVAEKETPETEAKPKTSKSAKKTKT